MKATARYVESANFAVRFYPEFQRFYQRKKAKKNGVVAIKALSNKLARASYYVMRDRVPYDIDRHFYNHSACGRESEKGLV